MEKRPIMSREWAMPNSRTFTIPPIERLIHRWIKGRNVVVDPFARNSKLGTITNDIDPTCDTMYHMDATDFLKTVGDSSADAVLYDPPYSPRQVAECYKKMGKTVSWRDTTSEYWRVQKAEIARILKPGGICVTCAWNSGGIGKNFGFEIEEILLVAHGGWHNDTIVTVERKTTDSPFGNKIDPKVFETIAEPDPEFVDNIMKKLNQYGDGFEELAK